MGVLSLYNAERKKPPVYRERKVTFWEQVIFFPLYAGLGILWGRGGDATEEISAESGKASYFGGVKEVFSVVVQVREKSGLYRAGNSHELLENIRI